MSTSMARAVKHNSMWKMRVRLIVDKVEFEATNKPSDDYVDSGSNNVSMKFHLETRRSEGRTHKTVRSRQLTPAGRVHSAI